MTLPNIERCNGSCNDTGFFPELWIVNRLWQAAITPGGAVLWVCQPDCAPSSRCSGLHWVCLLFICTLTAALKESRETKSYFIVSVCLWLSVEGFCLILWSQAVKRHCSWCSPVSSLLFEAGAARVQRSTSTTAPGSTFLGTTCAGCSPSSCSSSSSVRSPRASSLMGTLAWTQFFGMKKDLKWLRSI